MCHLEPGRTDRGNARNTAAGTSRPNSVLDYDNDAEAAARRYAELIPGPQVKTVTRFPKGAA